MTTTTSEHYPTIDVPEYMRETLAAFFTEDARMAEENVTQDASDWTTTARWATRASEEVRRGRLTLHAETDGDGDTLADYLSSAIENMTDTRGAFNDMDRPDALRAEAGLLVLAADVEESDMPTARAWAQHGATIVKLLGHEDAGAAV